MARSIRSRITTAIVAPLVCMLLLVLAIAGKVLVDHRQADVDEGLKARAAALAGHVSQSEDGWEVDFEGSTGPAPDVMDEVAAWQVRAHPNGSILAEWSPHLLHPRPSALVRSIPTTDQAHRPLLIEPADLIDRRSAEARHRVWTGVFLARIERGDVEMVHGLPPDLTAPPTIEVTVVRDMTSLDSQTGTLLARIGLAGLAGTFLSYLVGHWLSGRVTRPIEQHAAEAEAVRLPLQHAPLALSGSGDELDRLIETLNAAFLRVQEAYDRQARFTADASHELRTPLSVIRSEVELALRAQTLDASARESFQSVLHQSTRIQATLEQLLWLARTDVDPSPNKAPVRVSAVAQSVADDVRSDGLRAGRELPELTITGDPDVEIVGDAASLDMALRNLVDNAVRHTPAGRVEIALGRSAHGVEVVVRDTGCGIEPEHLPHVLERFYQADASRTGAHAGLGLPIVVLLVEAMDGTLRIESEPDKGTCVTLRFPTTH